MLMKSVMVSMPAGWGGGGVSGVLPPPPLPAPLPTKRSPTKLCFLLSHSGAARTPLVTSAKKAFFTYSGDTEEEGDVGTPPQARQSPFLAPQPPSPPQPTCREVSKTTSLELVGMRS